VGRKRGGGKENPGTAGRPFAFPVSESGKGGWEKKWGGGASIFWAGVGGTLALEGKEGEKKGGWFRFISATRCRSRNEKKGGGGGVVLFAW